MENQGEQGRVNWDLCVVPLSQGDIEQLIKRLCGEHDEGVLW